MTARKALIIYATKYGFILRWMMKRISRSAGGPIDTKRNHVLTDWIEVQKFVNQLIECPVVKFYRPTPQLQKPR